MWAVMTAQVFILVSVLQWQAIECGTWPFQRLADHLCNDILNPVWIVRHGAAAGLRELLREQAAAAAVEAPMLDNTSGWASPGGAGGLPAADSCVESS